MWLQVYKGWVCPVCCLTYWIPNVAVVVYRIFFTVSSEIPDCKVVVHVSSVFTIFLRFFLPSWLSPACTTYDLTVSFLSTTAGIHYFESFCTQIISSLLILVKVAD